MDQLQAYYRRARAHQISTYGNSGLHSQGVDLHQFVGGGAAYGEHAIAAYGSARRSVYAMAEARKFMKKHAGWMADQ